jgi:hypothetical protein
MYGRRSALGTTEGLPDVRASGDPIGWAPRAGSWPLSSSVALCIFRWGPSAVTQREVAGGPSSPCLVPLRGLVRAMAVLNGHAAHDFNVLNPIHLNPQYRVLYIRLDGATIQFMFLRPCSFNTALRLVLRPHFLVHFV